MSAGLSRGLSLVRSAKRRTLRREDFLEASIQGVLFPVSKPNLAVIVRFPDVTDEEFKSVLELAKPRLVADFRSVPTFSIGRLTRRLVFDVLSKNDALYVDLSAFPPQGERSDIANKSVSLLAETWKRQTGPIVLLTHRFDCPDDDLPLAIRSLFEQSSARWDVLEVPQFQES